jgi:Domain of Unknown Function with PDB structure (DUF3857)
MTVCLKSFLRVSYFVLVLSITFLSVIAMTLPATCPAQAIPPISADELKMTSDPQAPGASAVILFREVDRDDNIHTAHEDDFMRIKILTEEGRKYGDIEIPFDKANDNVVNIRARTVSPDGSSVDFDGKVFEKTIAKAQGLKYLAKTFTLPNVQVGSIIEYRYTYDFRELQLFESHWIISAHLFTRNAKFTLKPYQTTVYLGSNVGLRWTWKGLPDGVTPKQGPDKVVRMELQNIPAFQEEEFMPPPNELKARVDFIYTDEFLESTPDQYWRHVNKKRNDALESFIGKRKAMEEAVNQIVSPGDSQEIKLRKLYDRVQQLRNTSYEIRKSAEEEKRDKEKPAENVEDVWKRGYGNGQQLTWLYLALVRAAGFDAYGVWVSSRSEYFFSAQSMEQNKLRANVVLVKLNGKDLFFDPGAEFTPYGMLTWSETGTVGLCLNKDGGTWVKTTLPESSESRMERTAKFKLTEDGNLEGKVTVSCTGLEGMYYRLDVRNADDVARKKFLEERLKGQIPVSAEIELTKQPDWKNSETPLVAEFNVTIPGWASNAGKRAVMSAGLFTGAEKNLFEHANRVNPIYIRYPYEKIDDITIELPSGWQVGSVPAPQNQSGHVVTYSLQVVNDHGVLHVKRRLGMDFLILEQKYYSALRNFFQVVRTGDDEQIVLQPGAAAASN